MRIAPGFGLMMSLWMPLSIAQSDLGAEQGAEITPGTNTLAVLPLEILTDDPEGAELAESAFEKTLSTLASIDGIRVLGPETTWPYVNYELTRDSVHAILEEFRAVAVLRAVARGQRPTIAFQISLHRPSGMNGYLALLTLDPQITIQTGDGEPMALDSMLETELSKLVNTIQAL